MNVAPQMVSTMQFALDAVVRSTTYFFLGPKTLRHRSQMSGKTFKGPSITSHFAYRSSATIVLPLFPSMGRRNSQAVTSA